MKNLVGTLCLLWVVVCSAEEYPWIKKEVDFIPIDSLEFHRQEQETTQDTLQQQEVSSEDLKNTPETGIVISQETGEPLNDIQVFVRKGGIKLDSAWTNNGMYKFTITRDQAYEIYLTKKGLETVKIQNDTKANVGKFRRIEMRKQITQGRTLKVKKNVSKNSSAANLAKRTKSSGLVDIMGADQIKKGTDSDVASLSKRVTGTSVLGKFVFVRGLGERYTSMLINGLPVPTPEKDKRIVPQDLFPTSIVERFTIYKAFVPEILPNFAGGLIYLETKDLPEEDYFKISVSTGFKDYLGDGKFSNIGDERQADAASTTFADYLGVNDGSRDLPDGMPLYIDVKTHPTQTDRAIEMYRLTDNYKIESQEVLPNSSYSLDWGKLYKISETKKWGFVANMGFSNKYESQRDEAAGYRVSFLLDSNAASIGPDTNRMYYLIEENDRENWTSSYSTKFSALLNGGYESKDNYLSWKSFFANLSEDEIKYVKIAQRDRNQIELQHLYQMEYQRRSIVNSTLSGGHYIGESVLDSLSWGIGVSRAYNETPDQRRWQINETQFIRTDDNGQETTSSTFVLPNQGIMAKNYETFYENAASARNDFFFVVPPSIVRNDTIESQGAFLNKYILPVLNIGYLVDFKNREFNVKRYNVERGNYQSGEDPTDSIHVFFDKQRVGQEMLAGNQNYKFYTTPGDFDTYKAREFSFAHYYNIKQKFEILQRPIDINIGTRIEHYNLEVDIPFTSASILDNPEFAEEKAKDIKQNEINFYPMASVAVGLIDKLTLKALYAKTIVRPELRDKVPTRFYDPAEYQEVLGNDSLKNTTIQNYDVRLDYILPGNQLVSTSVFYKDFKDPVETYIDANSNPAVRKFQNATGGIIRGIEFEIDLHLDYYLKKNGLRKPWLNDINLYMNAAFIDSEVKLDTDNPSLALVTSKERPMLGQSPYLFNIRLSHEAKIKKSKLSTSILFNTFGRRIVDLGSENFPDVYEDPFNSLDGQIKYQFSNSEFSFKVKNMLNSTKTESMDNTIYMDRTYEGFTEEQVKGFYNGNNYTGETIKKRVISKKSKPGLDYSFKYSYKF